MAESDEVVEEGIEQAEDIETLQQTLAEEREKAEKYLANWQRCQADFVNYKQRAEQEKGGIIEFANSTLICNLLPIMDDLERALASVPVELNESNWTEGIRLIYNKLKATLEAQGLTEIIAKGEPFDPHLHEALMQQEGEEGMVIEETQKGYQFKGTLIRPSLVIVGKGRKRRREQTTKKEK
ncbi:MAG TPA: nucleotide exchange factor GrpE [Dehalococcoidia bacterium]|nr:nucleotide exchange factor GrpE [Dehalococcoidia bacterium]